MNRTLFLVGVLAVVGLALLIVACGSDDTPTPPPVTTVAPTTMTPAATGPGDPSAPPTLAPTAPSPLATPAPTVGPTPAPTVPPTLVAPTPAPTPEELEEADPRDAYFAMDRVLEVSIEIAEEDWDTLRNQTRTFDDLMAEIEEYNLSRPFADIYSWFSATVTIDGETHTEVGVRKKGFLGSQSDTKPSLKLRYDKYVDGQSLGGAMERMTLNNSIQDPSMINTCLSYQVFAAAGVPSPRCNFATVTVNGKGLGLYIHLEEIKKPFLARHFDSAEGNLYEGTVSDFTPEYRGTFEKKTNEDEDDWSDVDAVMAALQDPSEHGLEALSDLVDLDWFLSFWVTEVLVGHWDGYAGDRNNFHFYREPDGKFVFIPWGVDDTFHLKDDPNPFDNISNPPPSVLALTAIPNRLYNIPEWRANYAERLKDVLGTAWDADAILASVDEMAAIVQEHALPAERAKSAEDTERVRKFILKRTGEILADLTPEPPDWPEPYVGAGTGSGGDFSAFEVHFETTWGSNDSANPIEEGRVTYLLSEDGVQTGDRIEWMGVTAGPASSEEQALLPGVADSASITMMMFLPESGEIEGVTVVLPREMLADGAVLTLGEDPIGAVAWGIPSGAALPEWFEPLTAGTLELSVAGSAPDEVISGRFSGATEEESGPVAGEVESGTVEVGFETAWGSNTSPNPFAEGTITRLLSDGGEESPEGLGVIAGAAGPDEQLLLPGLEELASIAVLGFEDDGSLVGMTVVLPKSLLTGGASLVIGRDNIAGGIWAVAPGAAEPEFFLPFTEGTLTLTQAGTEPGAIIEGSFVGGYGSMTEAEPTRTYTYSGDEPDTSGSDSGLVINEVAASGDPLDWFELYNTGDSVIDLAGFVVADDLEDAAKRVSFPAGTTIAPGTYMQIEVDTDNWAGFKLGGDEELGIWTSEGVLVDSVDWDEGDAGEGASYSRLPDGTGEFHSVVSTPGYENEHHH